MPSEPSQPSVPNVPNVPNVHAEWRLAVARRATAAYTLNPKLAAFQAAEILLADTAALAAAHTEADLTSFRAALSEKRRPVDPLATSTERRSNRPNEPGRQAR